MLPVRGFFIGFATGFASGVAFRTLAESDFAPLKDVMKTTVGIAQKVGDVWSETYGRIVENLDDLRSQLRAERTRIVVTRTKDTKAQDSQMERGGGRKSASKKTRSARRPARELHA